MYMYWLFLSTVLLLEILVQRQQEDLNPNDWTWKVNSRKHKKTRSLLTIEEDEIHVHRRSFNTIVEMKEEMGVQDVDYQERFPQTPVCMEWCVWMQSFEHSCILLIRPLFKTFFFLDLLSIHFCFVCLWYYWNDWIGIQLCIYLCHYVIWKTIFVLLEQHIKIVW